mmetsp:Transcript_985/g.3100  ORF Transcript_985/g.3100 Transcript_985/m.3100 type:complete len:276 (-) Transcript_985:56-883(-)
MRRGISPAGSTRRPAARVGTPAQRHVAVGADARSVAAVAPRVPMTIGTCGPCGLRVTVHRHVGEREAWSRGHAVASLVHVDILIHQHGVVVVGPARAAVRDVQRRVLPRLSIRARDGPRAPVGREAHVARDAVAGLHIHRGRRRHRKPPVVRIDEPRLESPRPAALAVLQHRLQHRVAHLWRGCLEARPEVDHLAAKDRVAFGQRWDHPVRREARQRSRALQVRVGGVDLDRGRVGRRRFAAGSWRFGRRHVVHGPIGEGGDALGRSDVPSRHVD